MSRYLVVGDPIAHSKSPQIHAQFARQTGDSLSYDKQQVSKEDFAAFVESFFAEGGAGLNVTVPHKEAAFALAQETSQNAQLARAANTLWLDASGRLCADNTDGIGIVRDLTTNNAVPINGKHILVLGAGGAARGALAALINSEPASIFVLNRTFERADAMRSDFLSVYKLNVGDYQSLPDTRFDVVINATSMGLGDQAPPLSPELLGENCCCYDMMYGAEPTAFMNWSEKHGASKVLDGFGMLVEQAAESYKIWRGTRPETHAVIEILRP